TQFANMKTEIEQIDSQIQAIQDVLDAEARAASAVGQIQNQLNVSADQAQAVRDLDRQMFAAWAREGREGLNAEMARVQDQRLLAARNEMTTLTGAGGGFVVAPEFSRQLLEAMQQLGSVRQVATILRTQSGAPLSMPTTDATNEEGEIIPENAPASDEDATFGSASLGTYKFSSKVVTVPFELLQDSAIDLEGHIRGRLERRLSRVTERHFLLGTGTNQPHGLLTMAKVGAVGKTGTADRLTYEQMLYLKHAVDPAYRASKACRWMFNDRTLLGLKLLKDETGRPLWLPGLALGAPDTIDADPFVINQFMPDVGAGKKPLLYGDMSQYTVRDVMQMMLFRFSDSAYTRKGQVGFLAWMRCGGNLLDVGGAVQAFECAAS
ncbi:hypothetical protein QR66_16945, partial [Chromobacterium piscinae]